jgi:hypothetical protein
MNAAPTSHSIILLCIFTTSLNAAYIDQGMCFQMEAGVLLYEFSQRLTVVFYTLVP